MFDPISWHPCHLLRASLSLSVCSCGCAICSWRGMRCGTADDEDSWSDCVSDDDDHGCGSDCDGALENGYDTTYEEIDTISRVSYKRRFGMTGGQTYYQHQQTPNQTDPINRLHRAHQTAIFRFRTHHAPLNVQPHRIKKVCPAPTVMNAHCTTSKPEHYVSHEQM